MYRNFYGFTKYPFCNTPDTEFFFNSEKHTEALAHLTYVISERKGFSVITGDIGAGKTIVSRELLNRIDAKVEVGLITNTCLKEDDFLRAICEEFNLPVQDFSPGQLLSSLNDFFIRCLSENKNVILIVDEAQNLSPDTLEKIRMLSNLETEREKLIQIILMGQPELKDLLAQPRFEQLRQRVSLWYHLRPLNFSETRDYIGHRLAVVGSSTKSVFTATAVQSIFQHSKGVPRVINTLCDNSLLIGYIRNMRQITQDMVEEVVRDLGMGAEPAAPPASAAPVPAAPATASAAQTPTPSAAVAGPKRMTARFVKPLSTLAASFIVAAGIGVLLSSIRLPHRETAVLEVTQAARDGMQDIERIRQDYQAKLFQSFNQFKNQAEKWVDQQQEWLAKASSAPVLPATGIEVAVSIQKPELDLIPTECEL